MTSIATTATRFLRHGPGALITVALAGVAASYAA